MTDKNENDLEDDLYGEDLDVLSDDEVLIDEDWEEEDAQASAPPAGKSGAADASARQRSFVQKNFNWIVLGVVLVFGGIFFLGSGSNKNTQYPNEEVAEQAGLPSAAGQEVAQNEAEPPSDLPPLEDAQTQDGMAAGLPTDPVMADMAGAAGDSSGLTPLPGSQAEAPGLPPLEEAGAMPPAPVSNENPALPAPSSIDAQELPPMAPAPADDLPDVLPGALADAQEPAEMAVVEMPPEIVAEHAQEPQQEKAQEQAPVPMSATETPQPENAPAAAALPDAAALQMQVASLTEKMADQSAASQKQIKTLKDTIARLENQVADLSRKQATLPKAEKAAPKKMSKPASSVKAPAKKPETKTAKKPESKPVQQAQPVIRTLTPAAPQETLVNSWELRSASPGQAVIFAPRSGDMKSVSVGDNVTEIGRVTAIEKRGNLWVVQGTKGMIVR